MAKLFCKNYSTDFVEIRSCRNREGYKETNCSHLFFTFCLKKIAHHFKYPHPLSIPIFKQKMYIIYDKSNPKVIPPITYQNTINYHLYTFLIIDRVWPKGTINYSHSILTIYFQERQLDYNVIKCSFYFVWLEWQTLLCILKRITVSTLANTIEHFWLFIRLLNLLISKNQITRYFKIVH